MRALLGALMLCWCGTVFAQSPAPVPANQRNEASSEQEAAAADDRGTKVSPLIVDTYSQKSQWDAEQERKNGIESANAHAWDVGIGVATVLIGLFTCVILIVQARVFFVQAGRLKETVEEMKTATEATRTVANTLAGNARVQLRAYVFVERITVDNIAAGEIPIARVLIKNSGLTPAYDVEVRGALHAHKSAADLVPVDKLKPSPLINIGPGGMMTPESYFGGTLSAENMVGLNAGDRAFFVYGKIAYKDIFGKPHWTIYRAIQDGKAAPIGSNKVAVCEDGNGCDKE